MQRFAKLLDQLILTLSRNSKIRLLTDYFKTVPDPERGWAVAAITRDLEIKSFKPGMLRQMAEQHLDPVLYGLSYDFVGDMAETVSLIWPTTHGTNYLPTLSDVVETLDQATRAETPQIVEGWLNALDPTGRWALIKLITGGLRIGVAARTVKIALAAYGEKPVQEIEELWHGLEAPYTELFAWLDHKAEKPINAARAPFRPVMLAHPVEEKDKERIDPSHHMVEWKWDGIRVQAVREQGVARLYSRTGDDISGAFADVVESLEIDASFDGELLVYDPDKPPFAVRSFGDLQQRLNRKTVSKKMRQTHPAFIRVYDLLWLEGEDLRSLPFSTRRKRLEKLFEAHDFARMDLSPLVDFDDWESLAQKRAAPPLDAIEGVMIKKSDAVYVPGRPKGEWWKWKREPFIIDAVMLYAQRGHGKRSSFYSDYTFGCWRDVDGKRELVPVGKAYSGFTDEELKKLDKFVRNNTLNRFGPVREVRHEPDHGVVLEIAFEGLNKSTRHKSGVAMRFPRINRLRWDKPPSEADELATLEAML